MAKNFSTVYHECQNRLSLKWEYGDIAPRLRVVSKECFKYKGSTQKVTAQSTVAFVSFLQNEFLEWKLYCIFLKHKKTWICSI